jgi:hypothetical protein
MTTIYIIPASIILALAIGLVSVNSARAESAVEAEQPVRRLAYRTKDWSAMEAHLEDRLEQLVAEGKLTPEQQALIITKHQELKTRKQAQMESWSQMTPEERRAASEAHRQSLQNWSQENGFDALGLFGGQNQQGQRTHKNF